METFACPLPSFCWGTDCSFIQGHKNCRASMLLMQSASFAASNPKQPRYFLLALALLTNCLSTCSSLMVSASQLPALLTLLLQLPAITSALLQTHLHIFYCMFDNLIVGPRFPSFVQCLGAEIPSAYGDTCVWGLAGAQSWPLLTPGTTAAEGQNSGTAVPGLGCPSHLKEEATAQEC